jgi:hypothetical protein
LILIKDRIYGRLEDFVFFYNDEYYVKYENKVIDYGKRVVSHIPKFGDASKSPVGDTASPAGDAASPSGDAVVSRWRCIISFRDAHPPHSHPHVPQEMPHLQIAGYVTLLHLKYIWVTGTPYISHRPQKQQSKNPLRIIIS